MYPEAFRPNSFRKTKICHVDLTHSYIPQTYHTNQLRYQDQGTFPFNVSVFFQHKNVKSEKQATNGIQPGLAASVHASRRSETRSGDAFLHTCRRVTYEMLFNPSVDLKITNRLWQANNLICKRCRSQR